MLKQVPQFPEKKKKQTNKNKPTLYSYSFCIDFQGPNAEKS